MIRYVLSAILLLHSSLFFSQSAPQSSEIFLSTDNDDYATTIKNAVKEPFLLTDLTFESDVTFSKQEFDYLVDLKKGSRIEAADLIRAVYHLIKKNRFETIKIILNPADDGKHLQFKLHGFWIFKSLKFHGFMFGKENYRHYYALEPGERFNEEKHAHSLKAIKEALHEQGYFNALIHETIEKNAAAKTVDVHVSLDRKQRFKISNLTVAVKMALKKTSPTSMAGTIETLLTQELAGVPYTKTKINEAMESIKKSLAQQGFFHVAVEIDETIRSAQKKVDLAFNVTLHEQKKYTLVGNTTFSSHELVDQLLLFGEAAHMLPPSFMSDELLKWYKSRGFWSAAIDAQENDNEYSFTIQEGPRSFIADVIIIKSNGELDTKSKKIFSNVLKERFAHDELIQDAIDMLIDSYKDDGYLDVRLKKKEFLKNSQEQNGYILAISLDESGRYYINSITIPGYEGLLEKDPFIQFRFAKKVPFTASLITDHHTWLIHYFQRQKLAMDTIKPMIKKSGNTVNIIWRIEKTPLTHFGKTIISSTTNLPFPLIMRELDFKQGDVWDKSKLNSSMMKLKSLEIFDGIYFFPTSYGDLEKTVMLSLHDDDPYEIRTRIGFGLQQVSPRLTFGGITYKVGGTFLAKNPFNYGDYFRINADVLRSYRMLRIEYVRPWLFNMPVKTIIAGYSNKYQQPGFKKISENLYDVIQQGLQVCFKRNFAGVTSGLNVGFEYLETAIGSNEKSRLFALEIARAINFDPRLLDRKIPFIQAEPTIVIDRLAPNKLEPSQGTLTVATIKGMFPFGRTHGETFFIKFLIDHSIFIPIKSAVLALRFRFGHIFHHHFSNIMPSERFYLGGANSIRSYETDLCPPLGIFVNSCGKSQVVPQGGKTLANCMIEARIPIYKKLSGVIFEDVGFLSKNLRADFTIKGLLMATGFGLHFSTPIGPLRFEIGFKGDRDPTHLSYAWFLTFGNAF